MITSNSMYEKVKRKEKKKKALKLLYFKWHWKISRLYSYRTPFINRFVIYLAITDELHYSSQLNFIRDTAHTIYIHIYVYSSKNLSLSSL